MWYHNAIWLFFWKHNLVNGSHDIYPNNSLFLIIVAFIKKQIEFSDPRSKLSVQIWLNYYLLILIIIIINVSEIWWICKKFYFCKMVSLCSFLSTTTYYPKLQAWICTYVYMKCQSWILEFCFSDNLSLFSLDKSRKKKNRNNIERVSVSR